MVAFLGAFRPLPHSLGCSFNRMLRISLFTLPISVSRHASNCLKASLHSSNLVLPPPFCSLTFVDSTSGDMALPSAKQSVIIFLGTGMSEGILRVSCLTDPAKTCPVCTKAIEPGNKSQRLNTSILICYHGSSGRCNILIDAEKFFYHSALSWFPAYRIRTIDAVIITHSHADAIGGLDDLRDWTNNVQPYIPIYAAKRDFEVMKKTHYYIVDSSVILPDAAVSELEFIVIGGEPCVIHDLKDALRPDWSSSTHFGLPKALEEVRKIQPKRTRFTGMMHLMDHDKVNKYLATLMEREGLDVQLSYDGLRIPVSL